MLTPANRSFDPSGGSMRGTQNLGPSTSGFNGLSLVNSNGNPLGGVYGQPGAFGNPAAPAPTSNAPSTSSSYFNGSNWQPTFQTGLGGYNPSQYATTDTANILAGQIGSGLGLGGNVLQTQYPGSPFNIPSQNAIDFGGDSPLNAGLLAERYKKYDHATADRMTRDELALQGPKNWNLGDEYGSGSMFSAAPGGSQNLGGGQNIGQFVGENHSTAPVQPAPAAPPPATAAPVDQHNSAYVPTGNLGNPLAGPKTPTIGAPYPGLPQPGAASSAQTNPLNQLLQLLSGLSTSRQQNYNPYGNSRYYPSQPRSTYSPAAVQQQITPQMLLSLLLGF